MKNKLPEENMFNKIKKIFNKKLSFKTLFAISIVLVILTGSAFLFTNSESLTLNTINSKLLNLVQDEETDNDEQSSEENTEGDTDTENSTENPEEESSTESNTQSSTEESSSSSTDQDTSDQTDEDEDEGEDEPEPEPQPESPSAVVAFYSDNQSDTDEEDENHQRVVNYILSSGANPVFHAGDVMEDGTQDSLDRFNTVTQTLRATRTFYAALGNNDRKIGDSSTPSQLFLDNFVFPNNERWYSVNYGNLHMIILDSAFASTSTTQLNWLTNDLQTDNSQNKITGVMFHHPSFSSTISTYLVEYGADFIISGHLHSYNHYTTDGIDQFVLSGQPNIGYMIVKVYSDEIKVTVYNNSNTVIDTETINER